MIYIYMRGKYLKKICPKTESLDTLSATGRYGLRCYAVTHVPTDYTIILFSIFINTLNYQFI